jgi:hypothetical protein
MEAIVKKINGIKLLKFLPLIVFITTIGGYYLFNGFRQKEIYPSTDSLSAFNTKLPSPSLDLKNMYRNKLDIYMDALKDSIRRHKELENDTYLRTSKSPTELAESIPTTMSQRQTMTLIPPDPNENKVNAAIEKLYKELEKHTDTIRKPTQVLQSLAVPSSTSSPTPSGDYLEMEKLAAGMESTGEDIEIKRLDGMLDKIMQIQNTGRKHLSTAVRDSASLNVVRTNPDIVLPAFDHLAANDFYGLSSAIQLIDTVPDPFRGIQAVVHEDQTVKDGSSVKFRLLQDIYIKGIKIPANSFVYGLCRLGTERLEVSIKQALSNNALYPVELSVYDIDGIAGIYVPGAISRDVAKEGISQAIQNLELYSMDPGIGAQAAAAGVQAAKSLISKKSKTITLSLKAGHNVLLFNTRNL